MTNEIYGLLTRLAQKYKQIVTSHRGYDTYYCYRPDGHDFHIELFCASYTGPAPPGTNLRALKKAQSKTIKRKFRSAKAIVTVCAYVDGMLRKLAKCARLELHYTYRQTRDMLDTGRFELVIYYAIANYLDPTSHSPPLTFLTKTYEVAHLKSYPISDLLCSDVELNNFLSKIIADIDSRRPYYAA